MKNIYVIFFILFLSCSGKKVEVYSGVFTGEEYMCRAQVKGKVVSFPFREGDIIKKGNTLAIVDDMEAKLGVASVEYKVKDLRGRLKNAEEDLKKAESLYKSSAITEHQYEIAKRKYRSLLLGLKSSESALESKKENLKKFRITAPSGGYISVKYVKKGEIVMPGTPVAEILNPFLVYLNIYVPETKLPKISLDKAFDIKIDAFPDRVFKGKVVFIAKEAEFTPKNIQTTEERELLVYRVKILVDNSEGLIKQGVYGDAILK